MKPARGYYRTPTNAPANRAEGTLVDAVRLGAVCCIASTEKTRGRGRKCGEKKEGSERHVAVKGTVERKPRKLTHRQKKLLKALPGAPSVADAARQAGYSPKRADQSGYQALKQIAGNESILDLLKRHGLDDDRVIEEYLVPLLNATETKFFVHKGKVTSQREVVAWGPRAKGLDTLSMIRGWYKTEQPNDAPQIRSVVIDMAHRPPRPPPKMEPPVDISAPGAWP
jgi:hypothetical protein